MNLTKDTYFYLMNFASDKDCINMLSTNKKFNTEENFKNLMKKRYPLLMKFKKKRSWKFLFVNAIYYIEYLKEIEVPYVPSHSFNPKHFYLMYLEKRDIRYILYRVLTIIINEGGHYDILKSLLNTMKKKVDIKILLNDLLCNTIKILFDNGATNYVELLYVAVWHNNFPIVKYIINHGLSTIDHEEFIEAVSHTKTVNNSEIISYLNQFI